MLVYRSEFDVSLSVRTQFCRGWVLAMSAALCLLSGLKPACAAGCHVADRPILQSRFSWERDQSLDRTASFAAYAPPILTHPPCQGDVPHFSNPSSVTSPAFLPAAPPSNSRDSATFSPYCRIISNISRLRFDLIVPHDRSDSVLEPSGRNDCVSQCRHLGR